MNPKEKSPNEYIGLEAAALLKWRFACHARTHCYWSGPGLYHDDYARIVHGKLIRQYGL